MKNKIRRFLKRLTRPFTQPTPRGKVRWAVFGIVVLTLVAAVYDYAKPFNQAISWINAKTANVRVLKDYAIQPFPETPFQLGLDLQGGAHLVYRGNLTDVAVADRGEAMARLRDRIERRVNTLGVSEPRIQVSGQDRLVVELAGIDVAAAIKRIGETPVLEFREANEQQPQQELTPAQKQEMTDFNAAQKTKAQEIRNRLATGRESFEDLAKEFSEDAQTREKGGDLGAVTPRTHPDLIDAARNTIIGRVVPGVFEADDSFFIIRVDDRKETDVEMQLSHILICYEGSSQCQSEKTRQEALDFITNLAKEVTIANFADKAKEHSTEPNAAVSGGDLDWIAPASTIPAFETAAKALKVGTISAPVESEYGFHLIYKRAERPYGETFLHVIAFDKKETRDYLPEVEPYKQTGLSGKNIVDAQLTFDPNTNIPTVSIKFDEEGTKLFADLTRRNINKQVAIYLDGKSISEPTVQTEIANGEAVITGNFTVESGRELARQLKDGALPVEISLIQQQNVGASLGNESLQRSLYAGLVGAALVVLFMLLYYRALGLVAVLALGVYAAVALALFKLVGTTLTLSGIAGFLLSVGMAVDANILTFARFREERDAGRSMVDSMENAFRRAWPSIRDSNIATLITCAVLAYLGTSVVQGFAVTLAVGVVVSMFSAMIVTRAILRLVFGWRISKIGVLFATGLRLRG